MCKQSSDASFVINYGKILMYEGSNVVGTSIQSSQRKSKNAKL